ncbi:MAG: hypothetical protein RBU30_13825 [Polyangia bacterium]|nr:hypothetical protein [Polyangia bacterium]
MVRAFLVTISLFMGLSSSAPLASARQVFLNGVNLSAVDLPEITLKGCDVHVDAKGNIHITARGYKIQVDDKGNPDARPAPDRPPPSDSNIKTVGDADGRYYLVSFFNKKGATQYDIEVFINGQMIRRIRARSDQVAMEITRHVKRGQRNEIIFVARKNLAGTGRVSESEMDYFRVVVGSGFESKGQIVLKQSLLETRRTAAESQATHTEKHVVILR